MKEDNTIEIKPNSIKLDPKNYTPRKMNRGVVIVALIFLILGILNGIYHQNNLQLITSVFLIIWGLLCAVQV